MLDLMQMKTFVTVGRLKSLARASEVLKISSAAISKQISRLEEELKVQLLIRTTRKIELTEIGQSFFEQCERVLQEADSAYALITGIKEETSGSLKVLSSRDFAKSYIIPYLKEFLNKFPNISLTLELAERIPDLEKERIDILIGMSFSAAENVIQKKIATTRYALCASPAYLKKFGTPKTLSDLQNHRYITHSMRPKEMDLSVTPYLKLNDTESMIQLALQGMGIVKLHYHIVKDSLEKKKLVEILKEATKTELPIYVAYAQRRFTPANVRAFIDFFTKKIS